MTERPYILLVILAMPGKLLMYCSIASLIKRKGKRSYTTV